MTANARIYSIVAKIPRGKVATYGQIAVLTGIPRQARKVGRALYVLPVESDVPWQRVLNANGEVSRRKWSEAHLLQRQLLEEEGVVFDERGRVNFKRFRWQPSLQSAKNHYVIVNKKKARARRKTDRGFSVQ